MQNQFQIANDKVFGFSFSFESKLANMKRLLSELKTNFNGELPFDRVLTQLEVVSQELESSGKDGFFSAAIRSVFFSAMCFPNRFLLNLLRQEFHLKSF